MKLYLISGLMRLVRPLAKIKYANEPRKKQINKTKEKERESQKPIYNIKPKLHYRTIYNKKPNYVIDIAIIEN